VYTFKWYGQQNLARTQTFQPGLVENLIPTREGLMKLIHRAISGTFIGNPQTCLCLRAFPERNHSALPFIHQPQSRNIVGHYAEARQALPTTGVSLQPHMFDLRFGKGNNDI
jgi:hypothetical protein